MKFDDMLTMVVKRDLQADKIPMLLGEPGIGKSSWCETLVEGELRGKLFVLACNQLADKADLTGARLIPDEDGEYKQTFYPHEVIQDAVAYAKHNPRQTCVLFMDELNRTTPDVTSELLSIPTMRQIGKTRLPDNLKVIIAGNDKGNVTSLDEASVSRFVLYHVRPDVETFLSLDPELNPFVRSVLEKNPQTLFCKTIHDEKAANDDQDVYVDDEFDVDDGMSQFTTPRTISGLSKWMNLFSNDELKLMLATPCDQETDDGPANLLQETIEGHVGHTQFSVLLIREIQDNITRVDNKSNTIHISKPDGYDDLKSAKTVDEMRKRIHAISASNLFGILVYALYENEDNRVIIQEVSPHATEATRGDLNTLMTLNTNEQLDDENVRAFLATGCDMANKLEMLLER